jgi:hypothetical protein
MNDKFVFRGLLQHSKYLILYIYIYITLFLIAPPNKKWNRFLVTTYVKTTLQKIDFSTNCILKK